MKNLLIAVFSVAVIIVSPIIAVADFPDYPPVYPPYIYDINVLPENPSSTDPITFNIFLITGSRPGWVEQEQFFQNGASLQIDLNIDSGWGQSEDWWIHSMEIGCLQPGDYSLTVRYLAPISLGGWEVETRTIDFTVTPEPTTIILFALGIPVFRRFTRKVASR